MLTKPRKHMSNHVKNLFIFSSIVFSQHIYSIIPFSAGKIIKKPNHAFMFDQLMGYSGTQTTTFRKKQNHPCTIICRDLYSKNVVEKTENNESIIPKIVHIVWIGPKPAPAIFHECLASIGKHLSGWECKIWTDKDIPSLDLVNQEFYNEETNYGAKSDILRYELLYKFGGVYLDVDMIVQKPLDNLNNSYEFYTGLEPSNTDCILGNAIIASVPGHPILKDCIETIKDHRHFKNILERTGPLHFQKSFFKVLSQGDFKKIIALPAPFFYPNIKKIEPTAFTVHYWSHSWLVS